MYRPPPLVVVVPMPSVAIGGPPPPNESFGQARPPPMPPNPKLNPVIVSPHWAEPSSEFHSCWTSAQILPSTICRRFRGFSRLVMRFRPTPLKKLLRQVRFVTLIGGLMVVSSACTREVRPLAAACVIAAQPTLPVVVVVVAAPKDGPPRLAAASSVMNPSEAWRPIRVSPGWLCCRRVRVRRSGRARRCGGGSRGVSPRPPWRAAPPRRRRRLAGGRR